MAGRPKRTRKESTEHSVFRALADPTRRAILGRLRERGKLTAGALAEGFGVSRPAVSRHVRVLRNAGLVRQERDGRELLYRLDAAPLESVDDWLAAYRSFWADRLMELKSFVEGELDERGGK